MMREQWRGRGGRKKRSRERSVISLLLRLLHQTISHPSMPRSLPLLQAFRSLWTQLTSPLNPSPKTYTCSSHSYLCVCRTLLRIFCSGYCCLSVSTTEISSQSHVLRLKMGYQRKQTKKKDPCAPHLHSSTADTTPTLSSTRVHAQILTGLGIWSKLKSTNPRVGDWNPQQWFPALTLQRLISFPQPS